ncbi:hypothetical protein KDL01_04140 [Actinospica durhamensis]|uniref:Uncharacterized protein n=1 Tax=Actinospica durhamensis TaxID=1508375 RepID=A0A941EKA8_9ACTN|nr:hypothetical protein [Actinospica durhamensis]MBR7832433.1 hypothetical protein [Actinospica durhamensis]
MTEVEFGGGRDGAALGAYLERLLHFDKTAAVRVVGVGHALAAYSGPPFGGRPVLALRLAALKPDTAPFDLTVSAGKLLDGLAADDRTLTLPPALAGGPSWAGLLPPRTGWTRLGLVGVRALAQAANEGNADFRFRALGLDRAALDALGEEIWSRPVHAVQGEDGDSTLTLRTAHAAHALGFLGPDPEACEEFAPLARIGRWLRLDAPYGTVLQRD